MSKKMVFHLFLAAIFGSPNFSENKKQHWWDDEAKRLANERQDWEMVADIEDTGRVPKPPKKNKSSNMLVKNRKGTNMLARFITDELNSVFTQSFASTPTKTGKCKMGIRPDLMTKIREKANFRTVIKATLYHGIHNYLEIYSAHIYCRPTEWVCPPAKCVNGVACLELLIEHVSGLCPSVTF